ncbi:MAG TPA: hypothetical protein VHV08_10930 [Pirellulales bacterium]|nr:hypothetical protein [Pirellulales bacterium]
MAVLLRCSDLANIPGINGDEAWSGLQAVSLLHGESIAWHADRQSAQRDLFSAADSAPHVFPVDEDEFATDSTQRHTILDFAGNPLICITGPPEKFSQNY